MEFYKIQPPNFIKFSFEFYKLMPCVLVFTLLTSSFLIKARHKNIEIKAAQN